MKEKLLELLNNSYAPYSNYHVSSILVTKDGSIFGGVNVENASYSATICAERSAIVKAISNGYKREDFSELYVMSDGKKTPTPCFVCRQVLVELLDKDTKVTCLNTTGDTLEFLVKDLCPHPFDSEDLQ